MSGSEKAAKLVLAWSTGKDSAWTLEVLRARPKEVEVAALLTTVDQDDGEVAVHRIPAALRRRQVEAIGLPVIEVEVPRERTNKIYEERMAEGIARARARFGVEGIAFGDLFLKDIRDYRERQFAGSGLEIRFPLWEIPTAALAGTMIAGGLKARLVVVDRTRLDGGFAGREFDAALLRDLPPHVDPCGENGEFHTFAHDGPMFRHPVLHRLDGIESGERFTYARLSDAR